MDTPLLSDTMTFPDETISYASIPASYLIDYKLTTPVIKVNMDLKSIWYDYELIIYYVSKWFNTFAYLMPPSHCPNYNSKNAVESQSTGKMYVSTKLAMKITICQYNW